MANYRTTAAVVKEIMDTELTELQIRPFVASANVFVTAVLGSKNLGDTMLAEIEKWVAAHFASIRAPEVRSEGVGGASVTYLTGPMGKGLGQTRYGQQAMILDTSGTLVNIGKTPATVHTVDFLEGGTGT